ncbi:GPI transamidase component GPI17 [Nakaseomyces bracarensis]|uniref:GPI transamidase component GPI17 n=1 Tax=Nakaseomyces bracarensis TaxID=273131 RepID=A0ABR4NTT2_9SACH
MFLRKAVSVFFVVLYVVVGVPLWYKLTNIYRAPLPTSYIESLHEDAFQDVHVVIPVYIKSETYKFPDVHDAVQVQVNYLLNSREHDIDWSLQVLPYDEGVVGEAMKRGDDFHVVSLVLDTLSGFLPAYDSKEITVLYDDEAVATNDLPFFVAQTLVEHVFTIEWEKFSNYKSKKQNSMAVSYTPDIHLSISLLNGGGYPVEWEVEKTLKNFFTPFREFISPLVNFTVDTSIIYHNDLNLHALNNSDNVTWTELSHTIDLSDLSSMNYYKEFTTLNLAMVFPDPANAPEGLNFIHGKKKDNIVYDWSSFLVPQWGVLVINKHPLTSDSVISESYLEPVMFQFVADLTRLIGLTSENDELNTPYITIDSFKRLMTLQNIEKSVETLWSLVKLITSFQEMAVPQEVMGNVTQALDLRLEIIELLNNPDKGGDFVWNSALAKSNELVRLTELAFFHGEMVQQNFMPLKHKVSVYLPLFGPLSIVIFMGFVYVIREGRTINDATEEEEIVEETENEKVKENVDITEQ